MLLVVYVDVFTLESHPAFLPSSTPIYFLFFNFWDGKGDGVCKSRSHLHIPHSFSMFFIFTFYIFGWDSVL